MPYTLIGREVRFWFTLALRITREHPANRQRIGPRRRPQCRARDDVELALSPPVPSEPVERVYVNNGLLPVVRLVGNSREEVDLLTRFLPIAARECRLSINSCAVFCPTEATGRTIVSGLIARGIEASFMSGRELDLSRRGVKVLTLKSSKGLEFPVVALAGFVDAVYPVIPLNASEDEPDEILTRERRTMFVGMTRAMRALLVLVPMQAKSPLLEGFEAEYWNGGE